jgi:hypothetical protein
LHPGLASLSPLRGWFNGFFDRLFGRKFLSPVADIVSEDPLYLMSLAFLYSASLLSPTMDSAVVRANRTLFRSYHIQLLITRKGPVSPTKELL